MLGAMDEYERRYMRAKARVLGILDAMPTPGAEDAADHIAAERALVAFLRDVGHGDVADAFDRARGRVESWWYE